MEQFVSIDVEAAATGRGHNDRAPCRVAIVDRLERTLYHTIIQVPNLYSPLTELTGLTANEIRRGCTLDQALRDVRSFLGPNVVIVGQRPQGDVKWLQLMEGVDFKRMIDLAECFKMWNSYYGTYSYFSLAKTAYCLLGIVMQQAGTSHDPVEDAKISIRIYNRFVAPGSSHEARASEKLKKMMLAKGFPSCLMGKNRNIPIDGVCSHKFNASRCFCGQVTE